jgi:hypothetical protein
VSKAFWGSNPHLSATKPRTDGSGFLLYPEVERMLVMSVTIAMPRMSTDPELTTAQSKYVESLARAGAEVHWVELSDPDAAVAEALTCDGLLLPGGGDMDPAFYGQERIPACGERRGAAEGGQKQKRQCQNNHFSVFQEISTSLKWGCRPLRSGIRC